MRYQSLILATLTIAGCYSPTDRVEKLVHGELKIAGLYCYPDWESWKKKNNSNALKINEKDLLDDLEVMRVKTVKLLAAKKNKNPCTPEEEPYLFDGDFFWCDMVLENGARIQYKVSYDKKTGAPLFLRDNESDILFDHEFHFVQGSPLYSRIQGWILKTSEIKN